MFISVAVLPVALSLIIQAPANAVSGGQSSISWISNASDPYVNYHGSENELSSS